MAKSTEIYGAGFLWEKGKGLLRGAKEVRELRLNLFTGCNQHL